MARLRYITVLASVLLAGCFFHTRTPEAPIFGGGCDVDFRFNDTWQNVIFNLEGALHCGDANEYLKVIGADFVYEPTTILKATYPSVFATSWTKDRESSFIQSAFEGALYEAALTDSILSESDNGDIRTVTARYVIHEVDASGIPTGKSWDGIADYEFLLGSLVTMVLWRDNDASGLPFGELRAELGGGN